MIHSLAARMTARWVVVVVVLALGACATRGAPAPSLEARITLPPRDTVLIRAQASARRCERGWGVLLVGTDSDAGVLVWTRARSLASGDFQFLTRGDSTTPRGAMVVARFTVAGSPRGVTLDSGSVSLTVSGGRVSARVRGSGLEPATATRTTLDATFTSVLLAPDTASCR